jgi:hypothetical protein
MFLHSIIIAMYVHIAAFPCPIYVRLCCLHILGRLSNLVHPLYQMWQQQSVIMHLAHMLVTGL